MLIYLASGFSVMNVEGREEDLYNKFGTYHRLISFYDSIIGNNIYQVLELKRKIESCRDSLISDRPKRKK